MSERKPELTADQILSRFKEAKRRQYKAVYEKNIGKDERSKQRKVYFEAEARREKIEEGSSLGFVGEGTDPKSLEGGEMPWGFSEYEE